MLGHIGVTDTRSPTVVVGEIDHLPQRNHVGIPPAGAQHGKEMTHKCGVKSGSTAQHAAV